MSPLTSYALFVLFGSTAVILQGCSDKKSDSDTIATGAECKAASAKLAAMKDCTKTTDRCVKSETEPCSQDSDTCTCQATVATDSECKAANAELNTMKVCTKTMDRCVKSETEPCDKNSQCKCLTTVANDSECKAANAELNTMKVCTKTMDRCVKSETEPCDNNSQCKCLTTKANGASCGNSSGAPFLCETAHECLKTDFVGCGNGETNKSECTCRLICGTLESAGNSCICKARSNKMCDTQETCNTVGSNTVTNNAADSVCVTSTNVVQDGDTADGNKVCLGSTFAFICPDERICTAAGKDEREMCVVADGQSCKGDPLLTCSAGLTCVQADNTTPCVARGTADCSCKTVDRRRSLREM